MKKVLTVLFAILIGLYLLTGCSSCNQADKPYEPTYELEYLDCGGVQA